MMTSRVVGPLVIFLFLLFDFHSLLFAQETVPKQENKVQFQWAFGALKKGQGVQA